MTSISKLPEACQSVMMRLPCFENYCDENTEEDLEPLDKPHKSSIDNRELICGSRKPVFQIGSEISNKFLNLASIKEENESPASPKRKTFKTGGSRRHVKQYAMSMTDMF